MIMITRIMITRIMITRIMIDKDHDGYDHAEVDVHCALGPGSQIGTHLLSHHSVIHTHGVNSGVSFCLDSLISRYWAAGFQKYRMRIIIYLPRLYNLTMFVWLNLRSVITSPIIISLFLITIIILFLTPYSLTMFGWSNSESIMASLSKSDAMSSLASSYRST